MARRSWAQRIWYQTAKSFVRAFVSIAFRARYSGCANVPRTGGALLVSGTGLMLLADGAPAAALTALANGGGGGIACGWLLARAYERARHAEELRRNELAEAMASIKTLRGMLPVCAWCHRVRSDAGYWQQIEAYVAQHSDATFTHGLCQDCFDEHYGDEAEDEGNADPERRRR